MSIERGDLERRAAVHAALADPARLQIIDTLTLGDAAPSELAGLLGMPTNLVAHHTGVLEAAGLIVRRRSDADRRRNYLTLIPDALAQVGDGPTAAARRVLFVCTANTARSQLAVAIWSRYSKIPATSAGTHPADRIDPGAIAAAQRHQLRLPRRPPRHLDRVRADHDLIITVCDNAHEELAGADALHWSVADPVLSGRSADFDHTLADLTVRIDQLAPRLSPN